MRGHPSTEFIPSTVEGLGAGSEHEAQALFSGWDFSHLASRMIEKLKKESGLTRFPPIANARR